MMTACFATFSKLSAQEIMALWPCKEVVQPIHSLIWHLLMGILPMCKTHKDNAVIVFTDDFVKVECFSWWYINFGCSELKQAFLH